MLQTARAWTEPQFESDSEQQRLIEAWRHEFLHIAMMTAFVTMGCTAAEKRPNANDLAAIEANLPAEPAIDRAVRQGHFEVASRFVPAVFAAEAAYGDLVNALAAFAAARSRYLHDGDQRMALASLSAAAGTWRTTTRSFLQALEVFNRCGLLRTGRGPGAALAVQCPMRLMQLLRAAFDGETEPSLEIASTLNSLPDWVQRRRWERRDVKMKCGVESKGSCFVASLRNVSLGGALLDGVRQLPRGAKITLTLEAGRRLAAHIMWWRDGSVGVKFDEQLAHNDPLIDHDRD